MSKSTGSYYTPVKLSTFMWKHVSANFPKKSGLIVLEPSCGDGIFLQTKFNNKNGQNLEIDAIENNPQAIQKAQKGALSKNKTKINFFQEDFLEISLSREYDLVIGNPPYINKKLLTEHQRELCFEVHASKGLDRKNVKNIWSAFVIKSTQALKTNGVLAFVLPGELLQVDYAEEICSFFEKEFSRIEILTFEELVFPALGQDVVVIFAYKASEHSGVYYTQVHDLTNLESPVSFSLRKVASGTKWSNLFLSDEELKFLIKISKKIKEVSHFCSSTPGIVTGANDFFIVNKEKVKEYNLENFVMPIIQKYSLLENIISLDVAAFDKLSNAGKPCFFINLKDTPIDCLPIQLQTYLNIGIQKNLHDGYKTSRRKPWYNVPAVWIPEGVIFKHFYLYPRLLKNNAQSLFTDTAYRIIPHQEYDTQSIIFSFYNSLTLVFCELKGRFYGGGILELTPLEFKGLPLPYKPINDAKFSEFKQQFADNKPFKEILNHNDNDLLLNIGLTKTDIQNLQEIRKKLIARRLRNKFKLYKEQT